MVESEVAITTMFELSKKIYNRIDDYTERLNTLLWGPSPTTDEKKADPPESIQGTIEKQKDTQSRLDEFNL